MCGESAAKIQAHAGRAASAAPVASGEAPLKNTGKFVGGNADAIVRNCELYLFAELSGRKGDERMFVPIACRVLQELP